MPSNQTLTLLRLLTRALNACLLQSNRLTAALIKTPNIVSDRSGEVFGCPGSIAGRPSGSHVSRTSWLSIQRPAPLGPAETTELSTKSPVYFYFLKVQFVTRGHAILKILYTNKC